MENLETTIARCYENYTSDTYFERPSENSEKAVYMVIPVDNNRFEVPLFALSAFNKQLIKNDTPINCIVAKVQKSLTTSRYKGLLNAVTQVLNAGADTDKLLQLPKRVGEPNYYGTYGALFDEQYDPVVLQTWEIEKIHDSENNKPKFKFIKPLLRINPYVITNKDDTVQRFIINRIMPAALYYKPHAPFVTYNGFEILNFNLLHPVKIVIDDMPFLTKKVSNPSISTSDEELRQLALDNIDELLQ